jgi:long-chain acyl-CoA synthetase
MLANEKVLNKIKKDIDQANENFAQWEKIKKFKLTPEIWSVDSGHLTPTMKLKRKIIKSKYQDLLEEIYS